jgi:hypothetical protein
VLRHLRELSNRTCRCVTDGGAHVSEVFATKLEGLVAWVVVAKMCEREDGPAVGDDVKEPEQLRMEPP